MIREETNKPINRLHNVDLFEGKGTQVTCILPPPELSGYLDGSDDSTYVLCNIT